MKVAIEIIDDKNDLIKTYTRRTEEHYAEIEPIINSDEFKNDLDTYNFIEAKYMNRGIDIPFLQGYSYPQGVIGIISVKGEVLSPSG